MRVGVAEQPLELAGDPRSLVDAVRDRGDGNLVDAPVGPQAVPHLARHGTVELRDAVRVQRCAKSEGREPEARFARLDLAERREVLPRQAAALDDVVDVASDELRVEDLVAGRHRRVAW